MNRTPKCTNFQLVKNLPDDVNKTLILGVKMNLSSVILKHSI